MKRLLAWANETKIIKKQVKKNKSIIYGARAIRIQIGSMLSRPTRDWDIYSKRPKRSANTLQRDLDKVSGGNHYYATPSEFHKGTHKVYNIGQDNKRGTRDDIGLADFTQTKRGIKTRTIDGIRYTHLSESVKDKKRSLTEPQFAFRHDKDRNDLNRIELHKQVRKY